MTLYDPYLAHYGVKGMKWGVRKNRRGSAKKSDKKIRSEEPEKKPSGRPATKISKRAHRKDPASSLTNKELKIRNERLRLEREYKNLQNDKAFKKGRTVAGVVVTAAAAVAISAVSEAVKNSLRNKVSRGFDFAVNAGMQFIQSELEKVKNS